MQISFGAKIPINTCNIYDREKNKFVRATVYEIDCEDKKDINYIKHAKGCWDFKEQIADDAARKNKRLKKRMTNLWYHPNQQNNSIFDNQFFSIETPKGEIICLCETEEYGKDIDIAFIESGKRNRYKYAGQNMLASIAKNIIDSGRNLTVKVPVFASRSFYADECKFKRGRFSGYQLPNENMSDFIKKVEYETQGKILDCTY